MWLYVFLRYKYLIFFFFLESTYKYNQYIYIYICRVKKLSFLSLSYLLCIDINKLLTKKIIEKENLKFYMLSHAKQKKMFFKTLWNGTKYLKRKHFSV